MTDILYIGFDKNMERRLFHIRETAEHHVIGPIEEWVPRKTGGKFELGDRVTKTKGSNWTGRVVGTYSTALTPEGYAVESDFEHGSVQIYPAAALERALGTAEVS